MKKSFYYKFSSAVLITLVFFAISANAQHAKVNGTWNVSVQTSMGSGTPTFVFQHETETNFKGTYSGQLGEAAVKGTVKGNEVKFEFTIDNNLIEYKGTVDGNNMKGTLKLGTVTEGTFTGKRKVD